MYSEIASIVFLRICFFFCLIKQPRSPKSSKSQTIEEIVVYQPPADESRRWTSSNDRLRWHKYCHLHLYLFAIKKTWDEKIKRFYLQHSEINMTFIFTPWRHFANDFYYSMFRKVRSVCCSLLWRLCPSYHNFWYKARKFFILKLDPGWRLRFKLIR